MSDFAEMVRDLVVVVSSTRSGSTLVAELLRRCPSAITVPGELSPGLALAGLRYPETRSGSDELSADDAHVPRIQLFKDAIAVEAGARTPFLELDSVEPLVAQLVWRLFLQWPNEMITHDTVRELILELLQPSDLHHLDDHALGTLHLQLLDRLSEKHPSVDARYYDFAPEDLPTATREAGPPTGPPPTPFEVSPFLPLAPWRRAERDDVRMRPVVLKTATNVYRLPFLRRVFPNARFRLLYLIRNPAASVNGLYEGWRHPAFFYARVDRPLEIQGYSDVLPPWSRSWWKFELTPGWPEWCDRRLEDVCAYQWWRAHRAVADFRELESPDVQVLRYEEILDTSRRDAALETLASWVGVPLSEVRDAWNSNIPPLMATSRPAPGRWRERERLLLPAVTTTPMLDMAESLGYERDPRWWS